MQPTQTFYPQEMFNVSLRASALLDEMMKQLSITHPDDFTTAATTLSNKLKQQLQHEFDFLDKETQITLSIVNEPSDEIVNYWHPSITSTSPTQSWAALL